MSPIPDNSRNWEAAFLYLYGLIVRKGFAEQANSSQEYRTWLLREAETVDPRRWGQTDPDDYRAQAGDIL